jgi:hypothetical protein
MMSLLLPYAPPGLSLIAGWCVIGATPRGQPRTPALMLPHGRNRLNARRMAVLYTFRESSLCRHVHRELLRSVLLDVTPIISATACHQRNDVERYSRSRAVQLLPPPVTRLLLSHAFPSCIAGPGCSSRGEPGPVSRPRFGTVRLLETG